LHFRYQKRYDRTIHVFYSGEINHQSRWLLTDRPFERSSNLRQKTQIDLAFEGKDSSWSSNKHIYYKKHNTCAPAQKNAHNTPIFSSRPNFANHNQGDSCVDITSVLENTRQRRKRPGYNESSASLLARGKVAWTVGKPLSSSRVQLPEGLPLLPSTPAPLPKLCQGIKKQRERQRVNVSICAQSPSGWTAKKAATSFTADTALTDDGCQKRQRCPPESCR
jgi:hypothetical protein